MVFQMGFVNLPHRHLSDRRGGRHVLASAYSVLLCPVIAGLLIVGPIAAQDKLSPQAESAPGAATSTEPALVVTLASLDKLTNDVNYITGVVGQPQFGAIFTMMSGQFTRGIDTTQPIGFVVTLVDGAPEPIGLIPTSDVKQVLKSIEPQTGPVDEQPDGTLIIALGPNVVYIRQVGNWAVVARSSDLLDSAPANPGALFQGMGNEYDIAIRLKVQQVPKEVRGMLVGQLRQGFEQAMQQQAEDEQESTRQMAEGTIEQLEMVINDADELNLGWNIDQVGKQMNFDMSFTAMPGTNLAQMYGGQHPIASAFASVVRPDAAGYYHAAASISPEAIDQMRTSVDGSLSAVRKAIENAGDLNDEQRADINEMIDRVVKLTVASVSEGKMDFGALLLADETDFRFAFGAFVADGQEAAQVVKDLAEKVKNEPKAPRFLFDQEQYKGVTMHLVEADVPANEDEVRKIFGDTLKVHLGTGAKSVYLAVGNNSEALMKEIIDSSGDRAVAQRHVGQLRLTLLPVLRYAQSIEPNDSIAAMIDALSRAPDNGVVTAIADSIPNGQSTRFTIGEGVMQAVGAAARQAEQARQADQF
jgi:hypothetical protein